MRNKWKGKAKRFISSLMSVIMIFSMMAANGMAMTAYAEEADISTESSSEFTAKETVNPEKNESEQEDKLENGDEIGETEGPADVDLIMEQPQFLAANSSISAKPWYTDPDPGTASRPLRTAAFWRYLILIRRLRFMEILIHGFFTAGRRLFNLKLYFLSRPTSTIMAL